LRIFIICNTDANPDQITVALSIGNDLVSGGTR
jgi:hypothetical protein